MRSRERRSDGPGPDPLTASFGVSSFPAAAAAEDLLTDADRRLYDAKRPGKNRVVTAYTPFWLDVKVRARVA